VTDDSGEGPPKPPEKPDPFAPLPLANLPPVRRRGPLDPAEDAPRTRASGRPVPPDTRPPSAPPAAPPPAEPALVEPTPAASAATVATPAAAPPMSWTDLPAPPAGSAETHPSAESPDRAMSWTDLPAPLSGTANTQAPATDGALPVLPGSSSETELRAAVGSPPRPEAPARSRRRAPTPIDDDDDDGGGPSKRRSRKMMLVGALTLVVGGGIAAMVIIGKVNSERYLITCKADRVAVEQGRSFPPWGEATLDGAEWKALKIPPEAPCAPFETEDKAELAAHYLDILKDHATTLLTAREVTKIDDAEAQLKQALLVARSLAGDDDRIDARDEIDRLLGDVVYWRASAKLRSASDALVEAAKQFDMASAQRPRHVTDAAAWALYIRRLVDQLRAGPAGAAPSTFPPLPPSERPIAPPGVALPVEPGAGSDSAGSAADPVPPAPVDAGVPTGGVLL